MTGGTWCAGSHLAVVAPPSNAEYEWARHWLEPSEAVLWGRCRTPTDASHRGGPTVPRSPCLGEPGEIAGALLHDVGKLDAGLGMGRVVATAVGPRCERFRRYHDHEAIGARWLADGGSDPATVELVTGSAPRRLTARPDHSI